MDIPQHVKENVLFNLSEIPQEEQDTTFFPFSIKASETPQKLIPSVQYTLAKRGKTHGDFKENSEISQCLKEVLRSGKNWEDLSYPQKEALEMIFHKISRIVSGNPNEPDHWQDIAGYATLVENILTIGKSHPSL